MKFQEKLDYLVEMNHSLCIIQLKIHETADHHTIKNLMIGSCIFLTILQLE